MFVAFIYGISNIWTRIIEREIDKDKQGYYKRSLNKKKEKEKRNIAYERNAKKQLK